MEDSHSEHISDHNLSVCDISSSSFSSSPQQQSPVVVDCINNSATTIMRTPLQKYHQQQYQLSSEQDYSKSDFGNSCNSSKVRSNEQQREEPIYNCKTNVTVSNKFEKPLKISQVFQQISNDMNLNQMRSQLKEEQEDESLNYLNTQLLESESPVKNQTKNNHFRSDIKENIEEKHETTNSRDINMLKQRNEEKILESSNYNNNPNRNNNSSEVQNHNNSSSSQFSNQKWLNNNLSEQQEQCSYHSGDILAKFQSLLNNNQFKMNSSAGKQYWSSAQRILNDRLDISFEEEDETNQKKEMIPIVEDTDLNKDDQQAKINLQNENDDKSIKVQSVEVEKSYQNKSQKQHNIEQNFNNNLVSPSKLQTMKSEEISSRRTHSQNKNQSPNLENQHIITNRSSGKTSMSYEQKQSESKIHQEIEPTSSSVKPISLLKVLKSPFYYNLVKQEQQNLLEQEGQLQEIEELLREREGDQQDQGNDEMILQSILKQLNSSKSFYYQRKTLKQKQQQQMKQNLNSSMKDSKKNMLLESSQMNLSQQDNWLRLSDLKKIKELKKNDKKDDIKSEEKSNQSAYDIDQKIQTYIQSYSNNNKSSSSSSNTYRNTPNRNIALSRDSISPKNKRNNVSKLNSSSRDNQRVFINSTEEVNKTFASDINTPNDFQIRERDSLINYCIPNNFNDEEEDQFQEQLDKEKLTRNRRREVQTARIIDKNVEDVSASPTQRNTTSHINMHEINTNFSENHNQYHQIRGNLTSQEDKKITNQHFLQNQIQLLPLEQKNSKEGQFERSQKIIELLKKNTKKRVGELINFETLYQMFLDAQGGVSIPSTERTAKHKEEDYNKSILQQQYHQQQNEQQQQQQFINRNSHSKNQGNFKNNHQFTTPPQVITFRGKFRESSVSSKAKMKVKRNLFENEEGRYSHQQNKNIFLDNSTNNYLHSDFQKIEQQKKVNSLNSSCSCINQSQTTKSDINNISRIQHSSAQSVNNYTINSFLNTKNTSINITPNTNKNIDLNINEVPITLFDIYSDLSREILFILRNSTISLPFTNSQSANPCDLQPTSQIYRSLHILLSNHNITLIRAAAIISSSVLNTTSTYSSFSYTHNPQKLQVGQYSTNDELFFTQPLLLFHATTLETLGQLFESSFEEVYGSQPITFSLRTHLAQSAQQKSNRKKQLFIRNEQMQCSNKWRLMVSIVQLKKCRVEPSLTLESKQLNYHINKRLQQGYNSIYLEQSDAYILLNSHLATPHFLCEYFSK